MKSHWTISVLALSSGVWCAEPTQFCQVSPEIQAEFQKATAISASVTDPFAALDKAAPFLVLGNRYPNDLFVNEKYQDVIHENGIEGHLRLLERQYDGLTSKHAGDPLYQYLSLRAIVGRSTFGAIQSLNELLAEHPDFAPAHRTLAEIYGTEAFRDEEKERSEKEKFLALCPGGTFTQRPAPVPEPSPLIDQAGRLLGEDADPNRIIAMTIQGLKEFEWRSQRIRAFDWYSRDYKLQDARELRAKYWQAWPIQVRCHRKAGRPEMANVVLANMENRLALLRNQPGAAYWEALDALAQLYIEGNQMEQATRKIDELQHFLSENPDRAQTIPCTARLDNLRKRIVELQRADKTVGNGPSQL